MSQIRKSTPTETKPLPKHIEKYINSNHTFNSFGLINLSVLRSSTNTKLSNEELKKRINKRFAHEMANDKIEYIEKGK